MAATAEQMKLPRRRGKRGESYVKLATRLKYQELARKYGDPLEFGFMVLADTTQDIATRLYAMRCLLPFGETRQVAVAIDQRMSGAIELKMQQDDLFVSTYEQVPELIGASGDSLSTQAPPDSAAADSQALERVGDSPQSGKDGRSSQLADPPDG